MSISYLFAAILGVVQGLAEFLPISSSGHLVVFQQLVGSKFNSNNIPLSFDVFLHLSTLLVALWFLRTDISFVLKNIAGKDKEERLRARTLTMLVCIATIPAVIVVFLFKDSVEESFSSVRVCAFGFLITSVFLFFSDYKKVSYSRDNSNEDNHHWGLPTATQAFVIGCAQALAIMPGVSRSGSTIALALILGLSANAAIRFSFLMFIPAVIGASLKELGSLGSISSENLAAYLIGFVFAAIFGSISLSFLTTLVQKAKLRVFGFYTLLLGASLLFFGF